jgi:chromatin remodeling complex protein RSC6
MSTKPKKPSAFMKPVHVSEELAAIVGQGPMPRTEVTKRLWDYIKKNDLQSKSNRRNIEPDAKLAKVFGSNAAIDMFKMNAKVNKHIKDEAAVAN